MRDRIGKEGWSKSRIAGTRGGKGYLLSFCLFSFASFFSFSFSSFSFSFFCFLSALPSSFTNAAKSKRSDPFFFFDRPPKKFILKEGHRTTKERERESDRGESALSACALCKRVSPPLRLRQPLLFCFCVAFFFYLQLPHFVLCLFLLFCYPFLVWVSFFDGIRKEKTLSFTDTGDRRISFLRTFWLL